jgi:hypothetical protein
MHYSAHQGSYFAHRISLEGLGEDALAQSLSTARVDLNPHQIDAALFALSSPLSKGALLADEVGLGKTIEAELVVAQRWAEFFGLSEGYFLRLQNAYDTLEAKRRIAEQVAKIEPYKVA